MNRLPPGILKDQYIRLSWLPTAGFASSLQPLAALLRGPEFAGTFQAIVAPLMADAMSDDDRAWATAKHSAARQATRITRMLVAS